MECAQVHPKVTGLRIWQWQVMVAQQSRDVHATGFTLRLVTHHNDVRDRQRRSQRLRRPGVNFVVQGGALRMLRQMVVELHKSSVRELCRRWVSLRQIQRMRKLERLS